MKKIMSSCPICMSEGGGYLFIEELGIILI